MGLIVEIAKPFNQILRKIFYNVFSVAIFDYFSLEYLKYKNIMTYICTQGRMRDSKFHAIFRPFIYLYTSIKLAMPKTHRKVSGCGINIKHFK